MSLLIYERRIFFIQLILRNGFSSDYTGHVLMQHCEMRLVKERITHQSEGTLLVRQQGEHPHVLKILKMLALCMFTEE